MLKVWSNNDRVGNLASRYSLVGFAKGDIILGEISAVIFGVKHNPSGWPKNKEEQN